MVSSCMNHLPLVHAARRHHEFAVGMVDILVLSIRWLCHPRIPVSQVMYTSCLTRTWDQSHTCNQHSGTTKSAHEHIVSFLENNCKRYDHPQVQCTCSKHVTSLEPPTQKGRFGDEQYQSCRQTQYGDRHEGRNALPTSAVRVKLVKLQCIMCG